MLLAEAATIDLSVRTSLYGIYIASLFQCLRWLIFDDTRTLRRNVKPLTLIVAILVFLFTTANIIISFCTAYFSVHNKQLSYDKYIFASSTLDIVTALIGDAILMSQCWLIYNKSWRMICFPSLLWLATLGLSIAFIFTFAIALFELNQIWTTPLTRLLYALSSCHIITNVYSTSTIIHRIIQDTRGNANKESPTYRVFRIIIESGLFYTLASILNLAAATSGKQTVFYPVSSAINALATGIAYNLILIRTEQRQARQSSHTSKEKQAAGTKSISGLQFNNSSASTSEYLPDKKHVDPNTLA